MDCMFLFIDNKAGGTRQSYVVDPSIFSDSAIAALEICMETSILDVHLAGIDADDRA